MLKRAIHLPHVDLEREIHLDLSCGLVCEPETSIIEMLFG
jgi:hypothetical protein